MSHFAFLSCHDFYISCERLFHPNLEGQPMIILSQDGSVSACSKEARQLEIPIGVPYLEVKDFCSHNKVHVFSANHKLYGDLSQRVMDVLTETGLEVEAYTMDEAFIKFPETMTVESAEALCADVQQKIKKWVSLPTAIGLAPTKTLAKIANQKARRNDLGVFSLCCSYERQSVLDTFPIEEVWGVNENSLMLFNQLDVHTAQQLCDQDPLLIRREMGVVAERMLWELRGLSCLIMDENFAPKHSITCYVPHSFQKESCPKLSQFNTALDSINAYFAKDAVHLSERGSRNEWKTRSEKRSQQYGNSWSGIAFVKA